MAIDEESNKPEEGGFEYMKELSKAYAEAFRKRLAGRTPAMDDEKRAAIAEMQSEISRTAGRIALLSEREERKELARMLKESAEETLRVVGSDEEPSFVADPARLPPPAALLARATLLANRCLNLLLRHREADAKPVFLILSELSALYALAAIN